MASAPTIRGKDNLLKHFKATKQAHWKLYNDADKKTPVQVYLPGGNNVKVADSITALTEILDVLDPTGVYILDTYLPGSDKNFVRPETSIIFSLSEAQQNQPIQDQSKALSGVNNYSPDFSQHIKLIQDNAYLKAENDIKTQKLSEALQEVARLKNENDVLEDTILNYENEEDDEKEEEEKKGMFGNMPPSINEALAKLITEKGGMMIEGMFAKKIPTPNSVQINGTDDENKLYIAVCSELKNHDPKIIPHLQKLFLIAQSMPAIFQNIIQSLEDLKSE